MSKKVYALILIILILISLVGCQSNKTEIIKSGKDFSMFIATDIHYLTKELGAVGEQFEAFVASGDGKQLNYAEEIVDAFARDIRAKKPAVLIISGDLTYNGEKASHLSLSNKLAEIEESGTRVYVIPGNHDIQNPWARGFKDGKQYKVPSIDKSDFSKIYNSFGFSEAISADKTSLSYLAAPSEDVWLLMLDTNMYEFNSVLGVPTTNGKLKTETLEWIKQCAELAKKNNARIVTVMHHNLMEHNELLSEGFTLDNSKEAIETFASLDLDLVLSGHIHIQDIKAKKAGIASIYDITTSALSVYPQQYGVLKYSKAKGLDYSTAKVDVEGWGRKTGSMDKNIINFKEYSRNFFAEVSYNKVYQGLKKVESYSEEERKMMAQTMSLLNTNYFGGTVNAVRDEVLSSEGYKLWEADQEQFMRKYILSMLSDSYEDKTHLRIK